MDKALAIQKEVQKILGTDEVYLVGGSVRDLVMGNEAKDYDFTTSMLPEEMVEKVKAAGRRVYSVGKQFGTIGFKVPVGVEVDIDLGGQDLDSDDFDPNKTSMGKPKEVFEYVEVTTFRSEVYTSKSRKPEVKFVPSLEEDLARRDFTMNAMVLRGDGTIFDPYGGKLDIYAKQIKTVGLPKDRIQEDPLRMLRAARFAARYNFKIDPNFTGKARQLADRIYDVSVERWVQELDKLLTSDNVVVGLKALSSMELLERIIPETFLWPESTDVKYENADLAWKDMLNSICTHDEFNPKIARYVAGGICARLKFSNNRSDIILDKSNKKD